MIDKVVHIPVLLDEVISALSLTQDEVYVDATFGLGGYTKAILNNQNCKVVAIDRDPHAKIFADSLKRNYADRFYFKKGKFSELGKFLNELEIHKVAGVVFDLGVSSPQLDIKERGFSFNLDGPLDMRMDFNNNKLTAKEIINNYSERDLANIFYYYGEEKNSRKIAKQIINSRSKAPINTTSELSKIIKRVNFDRFKNPSTRVFQALRIYVNDELNELEFFLNKSINILKKKGRIAIIAFHSLEDRIVKNFIKKQSELSGQLKIVTKKPVLPSHSEIKINSRSRSAKLRVAEKI